MDQQTSTNESSTASQPHPALQLLPQPSRLPLEILVEIFLLSRPRLYLRQARHIERLSSVCRFWNHVVQSTPALWSQISICDSSSYVQKSFSKSGGCPIDVYGLRLTRHPWPKDNTPADVSRRFLEQVQPHTRRWRHVALRVLPGQLFIPPDAILPSLRTLRLYAFARAELDDGYLALLNQRQSPFLRDVFIDSPRLVRWDLISLPPTLSKLELSHVYSDYSLIDRWLSVAATCPNLAVFCLREVSTSPPIPNRLGSAVVKLNVLQKLDLHNVRSDLLVDLLVRLRLPEDCAIDVSCKVESPTPSASFLTPALSNQSNFQRAGKARQVTITLAPSYQEVLAVYHRWRINLYLPGEQAIRDALEWFSVRGEDSNTFAPHPEDSRVGVATSNDPPLTVTLKLWSFLYRKFTQIVAISNIRNISRIEMNHFSDEEKRAFLLYLSTPEDPNRPTSTMADCLLKNPEANQDAEGAWPFPGLCELVRKEFYDDVAYHVLLEPIAGRSGDDAAAERSGRAARSELPGPNVPWKKVP